MFWYLCVFCEHLTPEFASITRGDEQGDLFCSVGLQGDLFYSVGLHGNLSWLHSQYPTVKGIECRMQNTAAIDRSVLWSL